MELTVQLSIIHQESQCAKSLRFENVMKVITRIVTSFEQRG